MNPFLVPLQQVRVQVDAVPGREPATMALEGLQQTIAQVTGVEPVIGVAATLSAQGAYDRASLLSIHAARYSGDPTTWKGADGLPVLHVLYLDGNFTERPAGGLQLTGFPLLVLFRDQVHPPAAVVGSLQVASPSGDGSERTALVHEYGHALGLVGCGLPELKPRQPQASPCHSIDPESVMAHGYGRSADPWTMVVEDQAHSVWRFSADDWDDIRHYQSRF